MYWAVMTTRTIGNQPQKYNEPDNIIKKIVYIGST